MKLKARVRRLVDVVRKYQNWRQVLTDTRRGNEPTIRLRTGIVLTSPKNPWFEDVVRETFFDQIYTRHGCRLSPTDDVVDIGANVGVFTIFAARLARRVFAVEPHPENVRYLLLNAERNRLTNIVVEQGAVSDRAGVARLYGDKSPGYTLFDNDASTHAGTSSIEVPATTVGDLMRRYRLNRIDFLKMDCEGAEGLILSSITQDDLECINRICLEFHDNVSPLSHEQLQSRLARAGFSTAISQPKGYFGYIYAWR